MLDKTHTYLKALHKSVCDCSLSARIELVLYQTIYFTLSSLSTHLLSKFSIKKMLVWLFIIYFLTEINGIDFKKHGHLYFLFLLKFHFFLSLVIFQQSLRLSLI